MANTVTKAKSKRRRVRDSSGDCVTVGDTVAFSYGIPPVHVHARIIERGGKLIGLCPGHKPSEFNLRTLRRYVGEWYKVSTTE